MDNELLKAIVRRRWYGGEWVIERRLTRMFYRFKALACVLLNREFQSRDKRMMENWLYYGNTFIPIVVLDGGTSPGTDTHPTTYWHEELAVGRGLFRNWLYAVNSDSSD